MKRKFEGGKKKKKKSDSKSKKRKGKENSGKRASKYQKKKALQAKKAIKKRKIHVSKKAARDSIHEKRNLSLHKSKHGNPIRTTPNSAHIERANLLRAYFGTNIIPNMSPLNRGPDPWTSWSPVVSGNVKYSSMISPLPVTTPFGYG